MYKRISIILLMILLAPRSTQAQDSVDLFFMNQQMASGGNFIMGYNANAGYYEGNPFYHNEWKKGSFRTTSGNIFADVDMKYEAYTGALVIRHKGDSVYTNTSVVTEFQYDHLGMPIQFKNGFYDERNDITKEKYLQVIYEGKWSAYKDVTVIFKEANFDPVFMTGNRYDTFEQKNRYMVKNPDGEWAALIPRRRSLNRFFGDISGEVRDFVSDNHLDYGNDVHLMRIFEYASGLD